MVEFREVRDGDVEQVRDLFIEVYGHDYPYTDFYDTNWLKKAVYDDNVVFMLAEHEGQAVATCSAVCNVGELDDLIAEIGRLVASPTRRVPGAAKGLVQTVCQRIGRRIQFAFAETRTVHPVAQYLFTQQEYTPVGFEPLKYAIGGRRESVAVLANLSPMARELRRNNPRVIPEVAPLAQVALRNLGLPVDVVVEDELDGYLTGETFAVEQLHEQGMTPLLRIERGRVRNREIFGNFSLAHGFFHVARNDTDYLVARDGDTILGAVGFTVDEIDKKLRIFELIEFDDDVKGFLLAEVDRLAREELGVVYQEVDVSAYLPKIQRTFERLGYVPTAYCPAMVFELVERLDLVRMVKVTAPYDLGQIDLLDEVVPMYELVERSFVERQAGHAIAEGVRAADPFRGLSAAERYLLARIGTIRHCAAGEALVPTGELDGRIFAVVDGEIVHHTSAGAVARYGPGRVAGIQTLLADGGVSGATGPNAATLVAGTAHAQVVEIPAAALHDLMDRYPRIGYVVMGNLARTLSRGGITP